MIIVHPSWWFRLIVGFMQKIVSSKFAKKIVNVESIEELEEMISTSEMMIPANVRLHDQEENGEDYDEAELDQARAIMDGGRKARVFKVSLEISSSESDYPEEIKLLIEHLTNKGLMTEGIFRRAPNKEMFQILYQQIDNRQEINFDDFDVHTIASILKEFIRDLPETLIPSESYQILSDPSIKTMNDSELLPFIDSNFIKPLDKRRKKLLKDLIMLSAMTVQLSNTNRMSAKSLAVVWAPNMIRMDSRKDELETISNLIIILESMISNYDNVFCNKLF